MTDFFLDDSLAEQAWKMTKGERMDDTETTNWRKEKLRPIVERLEKTVACNCDLDNWEPDKDAGHSWVCRIYKMAMIEAFE